MLVKRPTKKELRTLPWCMKTKALPHRNAKKLFIRYVRSVNHSPANKKTHVINAIVMQNDPSLAME